MAFVSFEFNLDSVTFCKVNTSDGTSLIVVAAVVTSSVELGDSVVNVESNVVELLSLVLGSSDVVALVSSVVLVDSVTSPVDDGGYVVAVIASVELDAGVVDVVSSVALVAFVSFDCSDGGTMHSQCEAGQ